MFGIQHGFELIIIGLIALVILGPKRLPEMGKGLGQAIRGFKQETQGLTDEFTSMKDSVHSSVRDAVVPSSDNNSAKN
jgi:sec-independent protein translocase protein TatA